MSNENRNKENSLRHQSGMSVKHWHEKYRYNIKNSAPTTPYKIHTGPDTKILMFDN